MNSNEDYLDKLLAGALGNANTNSINEGNEDSSYFGVKENEDINAIDDNSIEEGPDDYFEGGYNEEPEGTSAVANDNPYVNMSQEELASFLNSIAGENIIKPQAPVEPKHNEVYEEVQEVYEETQDEAFGETQDEAFEEIQDEVYEETQGEVYEEAQDEVYDETQDEAYDDVPVVEDDFISEEIPVVEDEFISEEIPVVEEDFISEEVPVVDDDFISEDIPVVEDDFISEEIPVVEDNFISEEIPVAEDDFATEEIPVLDDDNIPEDIQEQTEDIVDNLTVPELSDDPNKMMSPDDIAALLAGMDAGEPAGDESVIEEPVIDEPVIEESVVEEPPVVDDDPNKMMSPDDIAALLAGMDAGEPAAEESAAEESVIEEPVAEEPVIEEPVVDDDPNKMMSPDDIAALIAGMDAGEPAAEESVVEEPVAEEVVEEPAVVDDDPNKMMSPDDIAALIAGMDAGEPAAEEPAVEESATEEQVIEEPAVEETSVEEAPAQLSQEEIDRESDELMSLLMEEDGAGSDLSADDIKAESMSDDLLDGLDFSEEDIMKQLEAAKEQGEAEARSESLSSKADLDNSDVTDVIDAIGDVGELGEIADVLNKADNSELVDPNIANAKPVNNNADNPETSAEEKPKKAGIKEFFGKLFKKKNKTSENSEENIATEDNSKTSGSEAPKTDNVNTAENEVGSEGLSELSDTPKADNIMSADDLFGNIAANGEPISDDELNGIVHSEEGAETSDGNSNGNSNGASNGASNVESKDGTADDAKKEKKKGFFAKLFEALTEEVEEEVVVAEENQLNLSDENKAALAALDGEGEEEGGKKGKKKKEKKPKEKKEKKPKKPKKEKLKAPKEENAKKIPKKHVSIVVMLAISILAATLLITSLVPKGMVMSEGRSEYYSGNYKEAFLYLYGKELNDSDKLLYDKAKTIVIIDRKYESYENYRKMGMDKEAVNSLFEGLKKYEKIKARATDLDVINEVDTTKTKILAALYNDYNITENEAYEILGYSDLDYTLKLDSIVNGTEFMKMQDKINIEHNFTTQDELNGNSEAPDNNLDDLLPEEEEYLNNRNSENNNDNFQDNNTEGLEDIGNNNDLDNMEQNNMNNGDNHNYAPNNQNKNVDVQIDSEYF